MKSNIFKGLSKKRFIYNEKLMMNVFKKGLVVAFLFVVFISVIIPIKKEDKEDTVSAQSMPSVSFFATKSQLMGEFSIDNGNSTDILGYINLGKNENGDVLKWHIVGKDPEIKGDNTVLYATTPIIHSSAFYETGHRYDYGTYEIEPTKMLYTNHYGISDIRGKLLDLLDEEEERFLSNKEKSMLNATLLEIQDLSNACYYKLYDKLYIADFMWENASGEAVEVFESQYQYRGYIGTNNNKKIHKNYFGNYNLWMRKPLDDGSLASMYNGSNVIGNGYTNQLGAIKPATNLNLESVIFASAVTVATSENEVVYGKITSGSAMDIRLDGEENLRGNIIKYNKNSVNYIATEGKTVIVQGNDGTNDWYYSLYLDGMVNGTRGKIESSTIKNALRLSSVPDLRNCKIWIEEKSVDGMIYAIPGKENYKPNVSAFADKEALMNDFTLANGNENDTVGYVNFGKNENGDVMKWYIVGKDSGITGDNMTLFANDILATSSYEDASKSYVYDDEWNCQYSADMTGKTVWSNHYGISKVRDIINSDFNNNTEKYFSESQKSIINRTAVTSIDAANKNDNGMNLEYITKDWLYVGCVEYMDNSAVGVSLGSLDNIVVKNKYLLNKETFTRTCSTTKGTLIITKVKNGTITQYTSYEKTIVPATNIDLSSVLFTSAATSATNIDKEVGGIITSNAAMDIRLDGSALLKKSLLEYSKEKVLYSAGVGQVVVIQGNDGENDWYYSKYITSNTTATLTASLIGTTVGLVDIPDLTQCKVWLEETDDNGTVYAVMGDEILHTSDISMFATKENIMNDFTLANSDASLNKVGYINFGKADADEDGIYEPMKWYILGKDSGVDGDNAVLYSTDTILPQTAMKMSDSYSVYSESMGVYTDGAPTSVSPFHYGASIVRASLNNLEINSNAFSISEQLLMNKSIVNYYDYANKKNYTICDKLYIGQGEGSANKIMFGVNAQIDVYNHYWYRYQGGNMWVSAISSSSFENVAANYSGGVGTWLSMNLLNVGAACDLNLANIAFSSAVPIITSNSAGTIANSEAMNLRLDGRSLMTSVGVEYNASSIIYSAKANQKLVVQGNDGTNEWYYAMKLEEDVTDGVLKASTIRNKVGLSNIPNLRGCSVWIEETIDTTTYAILAEQEIEHIDIIGIDEPTANVDLDTIASYKTPGIDTKNATVVWKLNGEIVTKAEYNRIYTASITLKCNLKYKISEDTTASVNGNTAMLVDNNDGTVTVIYTFDATDKGVTETPNITIDYINEKLVGFESGKNYIINGVDYNYITATLSISEGVMGTTISIVKKSENVDYTNSLPQYLDIPSRPDAPTGLYTTQENYKGFNDGQIGNTNNSMECKLTSEETWERCGNISTTRRKPGIHEVRYMANSTAFASKVATVTIQASDKAYYSVDIVWGDLKYKYQGKWSSSTFRYEPEEGTTGWTLVTPNVGNDEITITTRSNVEVSGEINATVDANYAVNYPDNHMNFILKNSLNEENKSFILEDAMGDLTGKKLTEKYTLGIEGAPRVLPTDNTVVANVTVLLNKE